MKGSYHNQKRSTQLVAKGFSTTKLDTMGSNNYWKVHSFNHQRFQEMIWMKNCRRVKLIILLQKAFETNVFAKDAWVPFTNCLCNKSSRITIHISPKLRRTIHKKVNTELQKKKIKILLKFCWELYTLEFLPLSHLYNNKNMKPLSWMIRG